MRSAQTIRNHLGNITPFITGFQQNQRSVQFEYIVSEAFAHIFDVSFFDSAHDNSTKTYRVTWRGTISPITQSPHGADTIARCYGYYLLIEPTRKTGANQWSDEFAPAIRHCNDFCRIENVNNQNVLCVLVCTSLHSDTYNSLKNPPNRNHKIIPLTTTNLEKILQTTMLANTITHLEIRRLLNNISITLENSISLVDFQSQTENDINKWQKLVLKNEKQIAIGMKACEVMRDLGRPTFFVSEIRIQLQQDAIINEYYDTIGEILTIKDIEDALKQYDMACFHSKSIQHEESIFEQIPKEDLKARMKKILKKVS